MLRESRFEEISANKKRSERRNVVLYKRDCGWGISKTREGRGDVRGSRQHI